MPGTSTVVRRFPLNFEIKSSAIGHVKNEHLIQQISGFMRSALQNFPIPFAGADFAVDREGLLWRIELNSFPSFRFFIRNCGRKPVNALYAFGADAASL